MKRNLLILAVLFGLLVVPAQADVDSAKTPLSGNTTVTEHTKFIRVHAGVVATGEQIEAQQVFGTFRIDGLIKTYNNLYSVVGFQNIIAGGEVNGENYDLGVCYFTRNPNSPKSQLYLILGNGLTHTGGTGKMGEYTYGGGFGFMVPWSAMDVTLMSQFKIVQIETDRVFHLSFGIHSGLDL